MVALEKYQNKRIAVYGMGITGRSAANKLKQLKAQVYCWDDNSVVRKKAKNLKFKIDKFWLNQRQLDNIIISPGIDINKCRIKKYLKKNSKIIITDLDLFFELNKNAQIISITGTNGKSTTCKLIEKILRTAKFKVKTLGNIGNPILFNNNLKKKHIFILEVSSYQLEYSKIFRSKHSALLNISPDHLERHKTMKNYIGIKLKIFFAQKKTDYSYINFKSKYFNNIKKILKIKNIKSKLILINKEKNNILSKKLKNKYFNSYGAVENLNFAYKISKNLNIKDKTIFKAINNFKGLPHRQEVVFSNKNLICINDSKATSFDASLQSLLSFNKIYWILGGQAKHKDYFNLKKVNKKIVKAYIIGKQTHLFENKIKKYIKYKVSKNIKTAIKDIHKDLYFNKKNKKTILFSPAAASFDQFKNFEVRGTYFKKLIFNRFKNGKNV